jgi:hypothetical protein
MKYIKISIVILLVSFISIFAYKLTTNNSSNKISLTKEQMKEMLSYTIDGNSTSSMPTKGSGYKVKSITCKSGSILTWDNDNWLLEVEKLESEDLCNIDFTTGTGSYTVTAVPSIAGSLDSTSKTTTENGQVTFYTKLVIDSVSGCTNEISDGKVIIKNVTSNTTCNINVSYMKLYDKLLADNPTRPGARTSFSSTLTSNNTKTLYTSTENGTTVYYFAGNATDNWVQFGGYYWRIIRTNSDGGVRLLYHGTSTTAENAYIGTSSFNTEYNDPMYVGYMYGTSNATAIDRSNTNNSTIKGVIDTWYKNNLNTNYGKYISTTAVYCNDRSNPAGGYNTGNTEFYYAARTRLDTNKTPSYDCATAEDKFTADSSTGNGKLKYPIALMTADEVSFAGGLWATNAPTWYYNSANGSSTGSTWWWLLSPYRWNGNHAYVFRVGGSSYPGYLDGSYVNFAIGARPVISLKSDVLYKTGDGSAESPYEIQETPDTISDVVKANAVNENGYRYEGSDPNNYIQMQKSDGTTEMWRIIGLFPDGESGENVIRVRKVGYESAAYDTNQTNHWPNTTLYTTLSSTYTLVNYKNTVNYKMYLGGSNNLYNYTSANLYDMERMLNSKGEAGKTSSTSYNSATTYVGSVGLMYPSDYGYAVLASDCARTINPSNYSGTSACYTNNWLYQGSSDIQWLISPKPSLVNIACIVNGSGYVLNFNSTAVVTNSGSFSPVMALKSDVVVTGSGTQSDPYIMK